MKIKKSKGERAFQVFNYAFLLLIMLVCLYPVWYVAVASFSNSNALTQHSGLLFRPIGFSIPASISDRSYFLRGRGDRIFR